jgi:hypothetical protein
MNNFEIIFSNKSKFHRLSQLPLQRNYVIKIFNKSYHFLPEEVLLISPSIFKFIQKTNQRFEIGINSRKDDSTKGKIMKSMDQIYSLYFIH